MASVEIPAIIPILVGFLLSYLALGAATNSAAEEKASGSVVVTGNVFCDACLEGRPSQNGYVISGASVAVECRLNRKGTMTVSITGETDENGEFRVAFPSNIFHSAYQLSKCSVKPLKSPHNSCRIPSKSAPSRLTLQSFSNGVLAYSAGSFSYRHETVPASCGYSKGEGEGVLRMMRGRAVAENFDQNWKVGPQTYTNPDPSLQWSPVGNAPFFQPYRIPKVPLPPGAPFVRPPFSKTPQGPPFNWPRPGTPRFPKNPPGRPFNSPTNPGSGFAFPPLPDAPPFSTPPFPQPTPTTPGLPPQPASDAPFGTTEYLTETGLQESTNPSRSFPPFQQPGTPRFPAFRPGTPGFPKFPPFTPGTPGFPKFPRGPPFNFPRPPQGSPGFPKTPLGPPFNFPRPGPPRPPFDIPLPQPPSSDAPFGAPTALCFPPESPPSDAPFGTPEPTSQNLEADLQPSTTPSLQWSSRSFPPLQQPGAPGFPKFPPGHPFHFPRPGTPGFPKFHPKPPFNFSRPGTPGSPKFHAARPPFNFPRPCPPGFPKSPAASPFDIPPTPQPTTPFDIPQAPSNAPFGTPGPPSE